ncbi:hypothetical protein AGMMS49532_05290 [Endomicrobiia bacterium]|nr:hypothetical protein AGMMS49532_05290 [Endomicrobiia bacterium]
MNYDAAEIVIKKKFFPSEQKKAGDTIEEKYKSDLQHSFNLAEVNYIQQEALNDSWRITDGLREKLESVNE